MKNLVPLPVEEVYVLPSIETFKGEPGVTVETSGRFVLVPGQVAAEFSEEERRYP